MRKGQVSSLIKGIYSRDRHMGRTRKPREYEKEFERKYRKENKEIR